MLLYSHKSSIYYDQLLRFICKWNDRTHNHISFRIYIYIDVWWCASARAKAYNWTTPTYMTFKMETKHLRCRPIDSIAQPKGCAPKRVMVCVCRILKDSISISSASVEHDIVCVCVSRTCLGSYRGSSLQMAVELPILTEEAWENHTFMLLGLSSFRSYIIFFTFWMSKSPWLIDFERHMQSVGLPIRWTMHIDIGFFF